MPNPFYYGGHVQPDQFVGRRAELQRIFAGLEVAHTGQMQSFSVVGPRRIGKSSLLFYVANRYATYPKDSGKYRFAYVDLQDASRKTLDGLLRTILISLGVSSVSDTLTLAKFQDEIFKLQAGGIYPVVCLDEFETLAQKTQVFDHDLYDSWRHLMNENVIAFITASKTSLNELSKQHGYTSPFFNVFTFLPLGELTNDEALELIDRGVNCDHPFGNAERDQMSILAGNHPAKLQLVGRLIYNAKVADDAIDWGKVRNEIEQQLKQVGLGEKSPMENSVNGAQSLLIAFFTGIGKFALEVVLRKKKGEASESSELIAGIVVVVLVIAVLFGFVPLGLFSSFLK